MADFTYYLNNFSKTLLKKGDVKLINQEIKEFGQDNTLTFCHQKQAGHIQCQPKMRDPDPPPLLSYI